MKKLKLTKVLKMFTNNVKSSNFEVSVKNQDECMMCIGAGHVFSPVRDVTQIPNAKREDMGSAELGSGDWVAGVAVGQGEGHALSRGPHSATESRTGIRQECQLPGEVPHTTRTSIIQVRRSSFHSICYFIGVRVKARSVWNKNIGPV